MVVPEDQRSELHGGDEAAHVVDLGIGITAVQDTGEVEELGAIVDLGPETLLEGFLGFTLQGDLLDEVQMGEDADDFWKTVCL